MEISAIASGSSGNCIYVSSGGTGILIDAGITGKRIVSNLQELACTPERDLQAILVTHEHHDHVSGVGVLARKFGLDVWANTPTWEGMKPYVGRIPEKQQKVFTSSNSFVIGDLQVTAFRTSHDSREPVGFLIDNGQKKLAVATDTGVMTSQMLTELKEAEYLILEANHDLAMLQGGRYPWPLKKRIMSDQGHLSNAASAAVVEFLVRHGKVCQGGVALGHLSQENNRPELALDTVCSRLTQAGIIPGRDVKVGLARRDRRTALFQAG